MPGRRDVEKELMEKAAELASKAKRSPRLRRQTQASDWMNMPADQLAQIVKNLDPKMIRELSSAIGVNLDPNVLSKIDAKSVEQLRNMVKRNL